MGYRSEVKSCIYDAPEVMDKFMADNAELYTKLTEDFGSQMRTLKMGDRRKIIYLDCEYSKWYDEFGDVQRWHEFLRIAVEADLNTEFVRVGEDSEGDIESDYTGDDCMNYLEPMTKIDVGFGYDGSLQEV
jgi:hypothetical protein